MVLPQLVCPIVILFYFLINPSFAGKITGALIFELNNPVDPPKRKKRNLVLKFLLFPIMRLDLGRIFIKNQVTSKSKQQQKLQKQAIY